MSKRAGTDSEAAGHERDETRALRLIAGVVLVNCLLLAPWWVLRGGPTPPWVALEAGVIGGAFALLPRGRASVVAAGATAALVILFSVVGLGDTAMRMSLRRPLNLYLDFWLLGAARNLLVGVLGPALALLAGLAVVAVIASLALGLAYLLVSIRVGRSVLSTRIGVLALVAFVSAGLTVERVPALAPHVDLPTVRLVRDQARRFAETRRERVEFADALALYPGSYEDVPELLARLSGRDVILGFVESYGLTALHDPRYSPVVGPRLDDMERRVAEAGLHLASGRLVAASQGGLSWLGHGSLLSGLWLGNQLRYDMMLASGRETLIDDFRRAGYRTVALMPAITMPWPEGERLGYDEIYAFRDIEYAGPPLNWVTMPDQFTWSFFQERIREAGSGPLFAELGLISSHAPWTPILPVLEDWDGIGDGAVFSRFEGAGERPEELWKDADRVRQHYARSVEYALHAMTAYAERYVDDRTLLIVMGDHQPAPLITGEGAVWDVPVHVISGDPALLEPFLAWGFEEGAWPDPDPELATLGMDHFRDWFVKAFSGP